MCFHDESWPVRDEACLACGTFCIAYPEECRPELPTLFDRWTEQLTDQIWSVREDAAVALGDAIEAYGQEMLGKVVGVMRKGIPAARDQPAMSREEYKRLQNDAGELLFVYIELFTSTSTFDNNTDKRTIKHRPILLL